MVYPARSAIPVLGPGFYQPVIDRNLEGSITVFASPPGYLFVDSLAETLRAYGRTILWFRAEEADRDPGTFLLSFLRAANRLSAGVGVATLKEMQARPGPVFGWTGLFSRLGQEMASALPETTTLVIEHAHILENAHPTLQLLANHLLPVLPPSFAIIFTSDRRLPAALFPGKTVNKGSGDLRLDATSGWMLARESGADLSQEWIQRAIQLTEGRVVALTGLFSASLTLGPAIVQQSLKRAKNYIDLLSRIAKALFSSAESAPLQGLSLVSRLHYSHPKLVEEAMEGVSPLSGPWFQPLEEDWIRLRRVWRAPILTAFGSRIRTNHVLLRRAARYLAENQAEREAIRLFLDLGDPASASRVIEGSAETLLNTGQWITLKQWLNLIPREILQNLPKLVLILGELATTEGKTQEALKHFSEAADLFSARRESKGVCQSLLAEATLSSWVGDSERAQARSLSVKAMAEASDLRWYKGWSEFQLGSLSASAGKLDEAMLYFSQASADLKEAHVEDHIQSIKSLVERKRVSRQKRIRFYREYLYARQAEEEAGKNLERLLSSPLDHLNSYLETWGWFNTPLAVKRLSTNLQIQGSDFPTGKNQSIHFLHKLLDKLVISRSYGELPEIIQQSEQIQSQDVYSPPQFEGSQLQNVEGEDTSDPPFMTILTGENISLGDTAILSVSAITPTMNFGHSVTTVHTPDIDLGYSLSIAAHLLGKFRLSVNNLPIKAWPSGRGNSVLKYLLYHHDRRIPRDVLMDVFWPDSSPQAARNSLNVTLHSLRQIFRTHTADPIIIFDNGAYGLNPEINLWIDVDEFERQLSSSKKLEAAGNLEEALRELELAASLYQGDFLEDDPYEDWAVFTRERTRIDYLDLLDHLNRIYFDQGHYTACASLCQIILNHDSCREDAHRRLMRCYFRMGKRHLALRQFQICIEALKNDLDIDPEPETVQLVSRIRRQEAV